MEARELAVRLIDAHVVDTGKAQLVNYIELVETELAGVRRENEALRAANQRLEIRVDEAVLVAADPFGRGYDAGMAAGHADLQACTQQMADAMLASERALEAERASARAAAEDADTVIGLLTVAVLVFALAAIGVGLMLAMR